MPGMKEVRRQRLADELLKDEHKSRIEKRSGSTLDAAVLKPRLDAIPLWYWTWRPLMHCCIANEAGKQNEAKKALAAVIDENKSRLSIIVGASGAGKQHLMDHVRATLQLKRIVLLNTREPRDEQERKTGQYEFVTELEWAAIRMRNEVLAEKVYKTNWVGVRRWRLEKMLDNGRCILECPARLALDIADLFPARLYFVSVFSDATLWERVEQELVRWKPSEIQIALDSTADTNTRQGEGGN